MKYTIQVAPEDCTGCGICVDVCPAKNKSRRSRLKAINMEPQAASCASRSARTGTSSWACRRRTAASIKSSSIRQQQVQQPLFEFSGACAGLRRDALPQAAHASCSATAAVANATGCSSIYGGNLPTTPWAQNAEGRGPAWANSLFEDNAEFGLGYPALARQAEGATRASCSRTVAACRRRTGRRLSSARRAARRGGYPRAARARGDAEGEAWTGLDTT